MVLADLELRQCLKFRVLGASARMVIETLGHSTISTTMDTYSHGMPSLCLEAADAMERVLVRTARWGFAVQLL